MILLAETPAPAAAAQALHIHLPRGLIGLKHLCHFRLEPVNHGWPFITFHSMADEAWNFMALEPGEIIPGYVVELSDEDAEELELYRSEDALVFNIVTVHTAAPQYATANLVGPIVANRHTLVGKQVIIANREQYTTHHVLVDERRQACAA